MKKRRGTREEHRDNKVIFFKSVRIKLIGVILIPVIFIVLLGWVSYNKSSSNSIRNYEKSSLTTLMMMSKYFELGFETVEGKASLFLSNDSVKKYYSGTYSEDSAKEIEQYKFVQNLLSSNSMNDSIIENIYLFANYGNGMSEGGVLPSDLYETFKLSEEGKAFIESKNKYMWSGYHKYLDTTLNKNNDRKIEDKYALALTYYLYNVSNKKIGLVVFDVKEEFLTKAMENTNFLKGSIIGFVTKDGKEILTGDYEEGFSYTKNDFYWEHLSEENLKKQTEGEFSYVNYNNKTYLYIYTTLKDQDITVCALIPKERIIEQSREVLWITISIVLIACFVAIIIGSIFANGIARTIAKTNHILHKAEKGDLKESVQINRTDEFMRLGDGINHMIKGMKNLIHQITQVSNIVSGNAYEVETNAVLLLQATKEINNVVEEIEDGTGIQVQDAMECLNQMSTLSNHIGRVSESAEKIEEIAEITKVITKEGTVIIEELKKKAKDTASITHVVINDIEKLEQTSFAVSAIIESINYISEQTNLLSLNATIEAARAGEYGKGFAVVANEIRKLALGTSSAANQVGAIINEMGNQTKRTVSTAKRAEDIVTSWEETLISTVDVFFNINKYVERLSTNLFQITEELIEIQKAKEDTLKAVASISATTGQTAAATGQLGATVVGQMSSVEALNTAAFRLGETVKNLEETVSVFMIE